MTEIFSNLPDVRTVLVDVRREIAIAKLTELDFQSHRLGGLVRDGLIDRGLAAETLYDAALENGLVSTHGEDFVQDILASGLEAQ
jgi:hypothetical protein